MRELIARYILIAILFSFIFTVVEAYTAPIEMESQQSATLNWGEKKEFRNYTIEAIDFTVSGDIKNVKIKLYKDGVYLEHRIMNINYPNNHWNYNEEDEIWIDVSNVYIEPPTKAYVDFYVTLRGLPELSIEVSTDASAYKANRYIQVTVKVKNTGSDSGTYKGARTGEINLNINTSGMQVMKGETQKYYYEIKRGVQVEDILLTLNAPSLMNKTTLYINATATGYDARNKQYNWSGSKAIDIESMIEITKLVSGSTGYLTPTPSETGVYMDETSGVSVVLRNYGSFPVYDVVINDSLLADFKLKSGSTNMKIDVLEPGLEKEKLLPFYVIIPLKPGTYTFPKATANWTYNGVNYFVESSQSSLVIHGPFIELTKTTDIKTAEKGGKINVTVTAKNSGDRTCSVNFSDAISENTKLVNGSLTKETVVLKAGESTSMAYTIELTANRTITLPEAISHYVDIKNYRAIARSNIVTIANIYDNQTNQNNTIPTTLPTQPPSTPVQPTPTKKVPGFELTALIAGLASALHLLRNKKRE